MAFPVSQLPLRVKIAPGADPNLSPGSWPKWVDISADVRFGPNDRVEFSDGRASEDTDVDTRRMSLTLDNRAHNDGRVAGRYIAGNPLSPYNGRLAKNTPIYAGLEVVTDSFDRSVTDGWGSPDGDQFDGLTWTVETTAAPFDVDGSTATVVRATADNVLARAVLTNGDAQDVYGEATFSCSAVVTGDDMRACVLARYTGFNDNWYLLYIGFNAAGVLALEIGRRLDGSYDVVAGTTLDLTYGANDEIRLAWQVVGATVCMKAWDPAGDEPDSWDLSFEDTEVVEGAGNGIGVWRTSGNTNVGSLTVTVDDYLLEAIEFPGYVRDWPARWDLSGNNAVVPIQCVGALDRIRQGDRGSAVVLSPLYRQLSGYEAALYLPLEDESSAVRPANAAQGGVGGYFDGSVSAGVSSDLPGAARVVQFGSDSDRIRGYPRQDLAKGTGFSCLYLLKFDALPGSAHDMIIVATNTTATADRWVIRFDGATINIRAFRRSDSVDIVPASPVLYGLDPTQWFAVELRLEVSGANTNWRLGWTQVGTNGFYFNSGSYASTTVPYVTSTDARSNSDFVGCQLAHHWVGQNTLPYFSQTFADVWAGFPNESASDRFGRILTEAGIPGFVEPGDSEPCGPQEIDTSLAILKSTQDADQGVMYEGGWGQAYRPRSKRYQRTVTLTLDADDGALAEPPAGDLDRPGIVNDVSISRRGGAQGVRYSDEEHVAREGRYPQAPTVNIAEDSRLIQHAAWMVFVGTRPGYRWPRINLDLARKPEFVNDWRGRPFGARLQVTNEPVQIVGQAPDVIVEGQTTVWGPHTWQVAANCSDAAAWEIPALDDDDMRVDSDNTELVDAIDADDLSFVGQVVLGKRWTVDPDEFPMTLGIFEAGCWTGEHVTVRAISMPGSVALTDGGFEDGVADWSPTGGSLVQSLAQAHAGTYSALLTVSGSPSQAYFRPLAAVAAPVAVGTDYTVRMWVRCSVSRNVFAAIDWYDSGLNYLSTSGATVAVTADTWTELTATATAPASAAFAGYGPTMSSSPANGTLLYVDELDLLDELVTDEQRFYVSARAVNGVEMSHAAGARIGLARPVYLAL